MEKGSKNTCIQISERCDQATLDRCPSKYIAEKNHRSVGICALHWPERFEKVKVRGGYEKPKNPPSVFSLPNSCRRQTAPTVQRSPNHRGISIEERNAATQRRNKEKDTIKKWEDFDKYFRNRSDVIVRSAEDGLELLKIINSPPELLFSIHVNTEFKGVATNKYINIMLRDVVTSFSGTLKTR